MLREQHILISHSLSLTPDSPLAFNSVMLLYIAVEESGRGDSLLKGLWNSMSHLFMLNLYICLCTQEASFTSENISHYIDTVSVKMERIMLLLET